MTVTSDRKKIPIIWNVLKIVVALLLVGFVLSRTDLEQIPVLFKNTSIFWLVIYATLFLSLTLLKAFQYYILVGRDVAYPRVLNVVVMQNAITNYLASSAGIVSYLALFRAEHGVKVSRSVIIFLLTKIGDLIIVWLALCVSSLLVWRTIEVFHSLIVVLAIGIGLVLLVFFLTVLFRQKFVSLLGKIMDSLRLSRLSLVQKGMSTLETLSEIELGRVTRTLGVALLLSTIYFVVSVLWIYSGFRTFNFQQDLRAVVFVTVILQLVSYIPVHVFGGLGITETSVLYFWNPFDIPQAELASVMLGLRILFYLLNLLPLIYLPVYTLFFGTKSDFSE